MKRKKRKYTRRPMTAERAIKTITSIRTRNNKLWMQLLRLAMTAKPRQAKKIIAGINANDREIGRWLSRISDF